MTLRVEWLDEGREAQAPPDPRYPDGIDFDAADPDVKSCFTFLRPYPAPRCGKFLIKCDVCGWVGLLSTAGRPDDPRSLRVRCKGN
jgi:hypothetical protein